MSDPLEFTTHINFDIKLELPSHSCVPLPIREVAGNLYDHDIIYNLSVITKKHHWTFTLNCVTSVSSFGQHTVALDIDLRPPNSN